jgi:hypothetical protein
MYQCLLNVWNALDPQIQLYVPCPKATTTMQSFYDDIDAHAVSLYNVLAQQKRRSQFKGMNYSRNLRHSPFQPSTFYSPNVQPYAGPQQAAWANQHYQGYGYGSRQPAQPLQPILKNPGYGNNSKTWFPPSQTDYQQRTQVHQNRSTTPNTPNGLYNAPRRNGTPPPGYVNNMGNPYAQKPNTPRVHFPARQRNISQVHQTDIDEQLDNFDQPDYTRNVYTHDMSPSTNSIMNQQNHPLGLAKRICSVLTQMPIFT